MHRTNIAVPKVVQDRIAPESIKLGFTFVFCLVTHFLRKLSQSRRELASTVGSQQATFVCWGASSPLGSLVIPLNCAVILPWCFHRDRSDMLGINHLEFSFQISYSGL